VVQVHCDEGVAIHIDPESCAGGREAAREVAEEIGYAPDGPILDLGAIKQPGGKIVRVWAVAGDASYHQAKVSTRIPLLNVIPAEEPVKN
jgi:predicted NUDIX family NTP pyrophosphohydrolase